MGSHDLQLGNIIRKVATQPFSDQKPGTSGLRKKVTVFQTAHYLENFVQSILNTLLPLKDKTLVLGGDGRYYNDQAIALIIRMCVANNVGKIILGKSGLLSTPAASALIRQHKADGGIILSASHNPGGADKDFGIKFNSANGGPASPAVTEEIYQNTLNIDHYWVSDIGVNKINIGHLGDTMIGNTLISVVDSVGMYADLMQSLFDFDLISDQIKNGKLNMCFDAMHAITGPYAQRVLSDVLGVDKAQLYNDKPLPNFGGISPDPNPVHAGDLYARMQLQDAPSLGAASDGDGDRNMILGRQIFVNPSDSLAVLTANAKSVPGYADGLAGVARSMPTSRAVDKVANKLGINCYETPTGWKYFGNLLDSGNISLCGEESFGTGSNHIREKDGLWAVLFWLNILAVKQQFVSDIMSAHWLEFGRHFYQRDDYEAIDSQQADSMINDLRSNLLNLAGKTYFDKTIKSADDFEYQDPVDGSISKGQGIRINFEDGSRVVYRLSGTGTEGATLRVYLEQYTQDRQKLDNSTRSELAQLSAASRDIVKLEHFTGVEKPTLSN